MDFLQAAADLGDTGRLLTVRHQVGKADRQDDAIDRLPRPMPLEQRQEGEPALAVGLRMGILRRVAPGRVDQHRLVGEPPVAIARAADTCHRLRLARPGKRKVQAGIDQCGGLAGARRADDDVPGDLVEEVALAARLPERRDRLVHAGFQHLCVAAVVLGAGHGGFQRLLRLAPSPEPDPVDDHRRSDDNADDHCAQPDRVQRPGAGEADQRAGEPDRGGKAGQRERAEDAQQPAGHSVSSRGIITSTRRFLARPSGVALSAIGSSSPLPSTFVRDGSLKCARDHLFDRLGAGDGEVEIRFEGAGLLRLDIVGMADDPDRPALGIESRRDAGRPRARTRL